MTRRAVYVCFVLLAGCIDPLTDGNLPPTAPPALPAPPCDDAACAPVPDPVVPACEELVIGSDASVDLPATTIGAPTVFHGATCGDHAMGPEQTYGWVAPSAGVYRISATATFPIALGVERTTCGGDPIACDAQLSGAASVTIGLAASEAVAIEVDADAGGAGDYELQIEREAETCGDGVCQAGEDCTSCPSDCGSCAAVPVCGDGVCDAGESQTCPADCDSTTTSSYCGDGTCDADEDSDSCPTDCGSSCDPTDPDCD